MKFTSVNHAINDIFPTLVEVLKHFAKDPSKTLTLTLTLTKSVTEHEAREKENMRPGPA